MKEYKKTYTNRYLYFRLLQYLKPYWKAFSLAVLCIIGIAATEPVFPAVLKYLLDNGFQTEDPRLIWVIPLGIILLFVLRGLLSFSANYLMTWVSSKLTADVRLEMFEKILSLPSQAFHDTSPSKLISYIMVDSGNLSDASTSVLVTLLRESLTAIALLIYLIYLDWVLTLVVLIAAPIVALVVRGFGKRMRASSKANMENIRLLFHDIEESSSAHKVIKIYGGKLQLLKRFHKDAERFRRSTMREAVPSSAITPVTHLAASLSVAVIVFIALSQMTSGATASAGGFVSFITALLMLISPIKQLSTINISLQRGLAACESVFAFIDADSEQESGKMEIKSAFGEIEFCNVNFAYPGTEQQILREVSFKLPAGQTYALVGSSGGGKTTVSALIPRFYSPTSGYIKIDGINISELTLNSLRSNIALVSQDIVLFNDTIRANIAFGSNLKVTDEDIAAAAKAANAWEFIIKLPNGLDATIGEDGAKLSGGQRQRIAIARALLKNAPILILDEATSALDTESERQVQEALVTLMKNRTTLVIAHRLSTIEHADKILVLDQGQIVESGSHAELLAKGGYYANLNRMQA
jgi:subfamily B ATP-binding cassette protein MsbA